MKFGPVMLQLGGVLLFSVMNAVLKLMLLTYPVVMATWWRYLFATMFTLVLRWLAGRPAITRAMLPVHVARGVIIAVSALAFFWSLTRLTLAEAITFTFLAPLLVPPLAALLLGERMQGASIAATAMGFAGILVAIGGLGGAMSAYRLAGVAAALGGAICYALGIILMRARAARDGPATVSMLGAAIPTMVLAPILLLLAASALPSAIPSPALVPAAGDVGWFVLASLCGALALQCFAMALAQTEPQTLVPFDYTALLWMALFGWLFFSEPVALRTIAGACIVVAASLWQARHNPKTTPTPFA